MLQTSSSSQTIRAGSTIETALQFFMANENFATAKAKLDQADMIDGMEQLSKAAEKLDNNVLDALDTQFQILPWPKMETALSNLFEKTPAIAQRKAAFLKRIQEAQETAQKLLETIRVTLSKEEELTLPGLEELLANLSPFKHHGDSFVEAARSISGHMTFLQEKDVFLEAEQLFKEGKVSDTIDKLKGLRSVQALTLLETAKVAVSVEKNRLLMAEAEELIRKCDFLRAAELLAPLMASRNGQAQVLWGRVQPHLFQRKTESNGLVWLKRGNPTTADTNTVYVMQGAFDGYT